MTRNAVYSLKSFYVAKQNVYNYSPFFLCISYNFIFEISINYPKVYPEHFLTNEILANSYHNQTNYYCHQAESKVGSRSSCFHCYILKIFICILNHIWSIDRGWRSPDMNLNLRKWFLFLKNSSMDKSSVSRNGTTSGLLKSSFLGVFMSTMIEIILKNKKN